MAASIPTIDLIPWDPASSAHVARLVQQRVACGWDEHSPEGWRVGQEEGKKAIQWIVLDLSDPASAAKLEQHLERFPSQSEALLDTAVSLGGRVRSASGRAFVPIGHISLDAAEEPGSYEINHFYVSSAIQHGGLGRLTMDAIESRATSEPLNAKTLLLATFATEELDNDMKWEALGMVKPKISNQEWYQRRGYTVYGRVDGKYKHPDKTGKMWTFDSVSMRKDIV